MAVIDDTPIDNVASTEPVAVPEPTFLEIMDRQLRLRGRQLWRAIVIPIRSLFFLEEDSMRDQMIMSNRADIELLTNRLARALQGVNAVNERLSAHEDAIPRMRAIKDQFDNTKRVEKEKRDAAIEAEASAQQDREDRLQAGVLT